MNNAKSGKEEFNEKFALRRETPVHDFQNGLTVEVTENWSGGPAGAAQFGVGDPDWGKICFYMTYSTVIFKFATPVSKVKFSVIGLSQQHDKSNYLINEVGAPGSKKIPMPANGGTGQPAKTVSFESALGIESFVIDHFNNDSSYLFIDNLIWE